MRSELREQAIILRVKEELSYSEIRKRLDVPKSTLSNWLNEFPLSKDKILELRRKGWSKGEASRERFRVTMRERKEKNALDIYAKQQKRLSKLSKNSLFAAGLMLYAAEGGKRKKETIVIANTDPNIIRFFIKWLNDFLDIPKDKLRVQLHLYENMDIENEKKFWRTKLQLKESQFYKANIRALRKASFTYKESFRHGTCSLYAFSVEKKTELMMSLKAFFDKYVNI